MHTTGGHAPSASGTARGVDLRKGPACQCRRSERGASRVVPCRFGPAHQLSGFHDSSPWQELEQVRVAAVHPIAETRLTTPLAWVALL